MKHTVSSGNKEKKMSSVIVDCPNCGQSVIITKLNCKIFRHAILKDTGKQINPHTGKNQCEKLLKKNKIYGCGKPFKINVVDGTYIPEVCDY